MVYIIQFLRDSVFWQKLVHVDLCHCVNLYFDECQKNKNYFFKMCFANIGGLMQSK